MDNQEIYKEYHLLHIYCPECGSDYMEQTTMGSMFISLETARDRNSSICGGCGWVGIIHDLVSLEEKKTIGVWYEIYFYYYFNCSCISSGL